MSLPALPLAPLFGALALVPAMIGPLPGDATGPTLTAALCNGGTVTIPLGPRKLPADPAGCHPKGCHAGTCRDDKSGKLISRKDG